MPLTLGALEDGTQEGLCFFASIPTALPLCRALSGPGRGHVCAVGL